MKTIDQTTNQLTERINSVDAMTHSVFFDKDAFEHCMRVAKLFSSSSMVPVIYRSWDEKKGVENPGALSNCVIALNMAKRMNKDPLMVMQNLHIIEGRPSWSSPWIIACINETGRFTTLKFQITDKGMKEVEYVVTTWNDKKPQKTIQKTSIRNIECVAYATEKLTGERIESPPVDMEMAVKEGWYSKNGSKWQTMPELMLRYRAASFFGRLNTPEILMGLPSKEEDEDMIDINPPPANSSADKKEHHVIENEIKELPAYPDNQLAMNLPKWRLGKINAEDVINKLSLRYVLTQEQKDKIKNMSQKEVQTAPPPEPLTVPPPTTDGVSTVHPTVVETTKQDMDLFVSAMESAERR
jgi:hypothetical protein